MDFLKDIEPGPLDEYRKQASFDWKQMALVMEEEKLLRFKVYNIIWHESEKFSVKP